VIPTAAVAVIAIAVVLVVTLPGHSSPHKAPPVPWVAKVAGEIIGWNTTNGTLVAMSPAGTVDKQPPLVTNVGQSLQTSVDGAVVHIGTGSRFYYLENRRLVAVPYGFPPGSFRSTDIYSFSPFAGHGQSIVVGGTGPTEASETPTIINLNTGTRHTMPGATPDVVIGDPPSKGAWVSVSHGLPTSSNENPQQPDSRIEYRTPGKAPKTLTDVAGIDHITHFSPKRALELTPYPSGNGKEIAVDALQIGPRPAPEDIVVLARDGGVLGRVPATNLEQLTWASFLNELLILQTPGALTIWQPGSPVSKPIQLPSSPGGWGACQFDPTVKYVVCAGFGISDNVTKWAMVRLADRTVVTEPASEIPVAWSP
jgi:hypothetical protein